MFVNQLLAIVIALVYLLTPYAGGSGVNPVDQAPVPPNTVVYGIVMYDNAPVLPNPIQYPPEGQPTVIVYGTVKCTNVGWPTGSVEFDLAFGGTDTGREFYAFTDDYGNYAIPLWADETYIVWWNWDDYQTVFKLPDVPFYKLDIYTNDCPFYWVPLPGIMKQLNPDTVGQ